MGVGNSHNRHFNKGFIVATPEGTLDDDIVINSDELVNTLKEKIQEEKKKL